MLFPITQEHFLGLSEEEKVAVSYEIVLIGFKVSTQRLGRHSEVFTELTLLE